MILVAWSGNGDEFGVGKTEEVRMLSSGCALNVKVLVRAFFPGR